MGEVATGVHAADAGTISQVACAGEQPREDRPASTSPLYAAGVYLATEQRDFSGQLQLMVDRIYRKLDACLKFQKEMILRM